MGDRVITVSMDESELGSLAYTLKELHEIASPNDQVKLTIDFESGEVVMDIAPRLGYVVRRKY